MKTLKKSLPVILFFIALISDPSLVAAQKSSASKAAVIKNLTDTQRYVFHAETASPMSGLLRILTSDYTVSVSKDTVVSDLPYFGRAYSAPLNPSEGGIRFTSVKFSNLVIPRKKSGWDVIIKPKDAPDVQQLYMTIFENGKASLQVTSVNRQLISFNGYVKEKK
jgi:Domain of unknown function (DUF4251)